MEYHYKDIFLQPKYSELNSRSEANTSIQFGPKTFVLPVVPANMKKVIDEKLAIWLAEQNYFYVMHRFGTDQKSFCKKMMCNGLYTSISLGVNKDSYEAINELKFSNIKPDYITIDIAHGYCRKMKTMLMYLKKELPESFIIGGNVCTRQAVQALEEWGADAVKVGIGPGSVCTTKLQTGFSRPQFSAVLDCASVASTPVVADGGISSNGDIAKALVAGASMVMCGGLFAGHDESPGEEVTYVNMEGDVIGRGKDYFGSASENNKSDKRHVEGKKIIVKIKGPIAETYRDITESLKSSISYAGGDNLSAFNTVDWVTHQR